MKATTRRLQGEEMLETLYTLSSYSLHPSPPYQNKDEWVADALDDIQLIINITQSYLTGSPVAFTRS